MTLPLSDDLSLPAKVRLTVLAGTSEFLNFESGESGAGRRLALLAYLHLGPPVTTRDELCELLWDPRPGKDAQHRLRELISAARRDLPSGTLITEGRTLRVDRQTVDCDVDGFRKAITDGRLEDAAALYQSDFLSDCSPRGASYFREWADEYGRQLRREYLKLLRDLVDRSRHVGDWGTAAFWAERLWDADRDDEALAKQLIELQLLAGSRRDLLRCAGAVELHFREQHGSLSHELDKLLVKARVIPTAAAAQEARFTVPETSSGGETAPVKEAGAARPVHPHRPGHAVVAAALLTGVVVWLGGALATTEPGHLFGGGGTLVIKQANGTVHAVRFVGSSATDTAPVQHELADSILVWSRQWSQAANAVADICEPIGTDNREACIRWLDGRPSRVVAPHPGEDIGLAWSPDGLRLLFKSDRGVTGVYNYDLHAVDLRSGQVHRVSDDAFQTEGEWSPDGSRIAVVGRGPNEDSIYIRTVEGRTVASRGFARVRKYTWTPDGRFLAAVVQGTTSRFYLISAERDIELRTPFDSIQEFVWSPDGKQIALAGTRHGTRHLLVCAWHACTRPLLEIPGAVRAAWIGDQPGRYVETVKLSADFVRVAAGEKLRLTIRTYDQHGDGIAAPYLLSSVLPTSAGWIDSARTFHALTPGRAMIVASAGGWRADTLVVTVTSSETDLLLSEDWERGLDTTNWKPYGSPLPEVVGSAGQRVFRNNGDAKYPSGAVTRTVFDISGGVTLEWRQSTPLTGTFWQEIWIDLLAAPISAFSRGPGEPYRSVPEDISVRTPQQFFQPPVSKYWVACGDSRAPESPYPSQFQSGGWHQFALQIHPSGHCELIVDGRILVASNQTRVPDLKALRRLAIGGRTHQTQILLDDVRLWRGIRWGIAEDGQANLIHNDTPRNPR